MDITKRTEHLRVPFAINHLCDHLQLHSEALHSQVSSESTHQLKFVSENMLSCSSIEMITGRSFMHMHWLANQIFYLQYDGFEAMGGNIAT